MLFLMHIHLNSSCLLGILQAAGKVRKILRFMPRRPVVTRWNSLYDCVRQLVTVMKDPEGIKTMRRAFDSAGMNTSLSSTSAGIGSAAEVEVLREYVKV